jgi:hypothetical protein
MPQVLDIIAYIPTDYEARTGAFNKSEENYGKNRIKKSLLKGAFQWIFLKLRVQGLSGKMKEKFYGWNLMEITA